MWYALNFAVKACLARRRFLPLLFDFCHCAEDEDHIDGEARGKPAREMQRGGSSTREERKSAPTRKLSTPLRHIRSGRKRALTYTKTHHGLTTRTCTLYTLQREHMSKRSGKEHRPTNAETHNNQIRIVLQNAQTHDQHRKR